mgnify:CR=1 FL=1
MSRRAVPGAVTSSGSAGEPGFDPGQAVDAAQDAVCSITGTSKEAYLKAVKAFCATGRPDKAGTGEEDQWFEGRYIDLWERRGGEWKIVRHQLIPRGTRVQSD